MGSGRSATSESESLGLSLSARLRIIRLARASITSFNRIISYDKVIESDSVARVIRRRDCLNSF